MPDLSVLIPTRREEWLNRTIADVLAHSEAATEIVCVLDGSWPVEPIPDDPRVILIHTSTSIGQRAAVNMAARASRGRYLLKLDAHCAVGPGFDRILLEDIEPGWTLVPRMYNLHVFDWVCSACGHRRYQGPTPVACEKCGGTMARDIVWKPRTRPCSTAMRFDRDLKFGYWSAYKKRQRGELVDTMSLLGACWMVERGRFFELDLCDEGHGSWGQMGTEVACKTWLSGGRLVCDKRTWFAHLFRTQGGDFGFPYPLSGKDVDRARQYSRHLWRPDEPGEMPRWEQAVHPLAWLVDRFAPVPGWEGWENERPATVLYYTCNTHDRNIEAACRRQLRVAARGLPIGCVSLGPADFGDWQIALDLERSPLTMHRQIVAGLERIAGGTVFLAESDVLYHPSHFEFRPPRRDTFYYNTNVWKVWPDGLAVWTDDLQQVSGLCADRDLLLGFFRRRVAEIEAGGFDRHYEPSPKTGEGRIENWQSGAPNVDLRHEKTLTRGKRSPDEFRNPRYARGFRSAREVPGWGATTGILAGLEG